MASLVLVSRFYAVILGSKLQLHTTNESSIMAEVPAVYQKVHKNQKSASAFNLHRYHQSKLVLNIFRKLGLGGAELHHQH